MRASAEQRRHSPPGLLPAAGAAALAAIVGLRVAETRHRRSMQELESARSRDLGSAHSEALALLARAAEYRDDGAAQHTRRVASVAAEIAAGLGLDACEVARLREAALLHDVGKLAIPDELLLKRGPLTDDERRTMALHTIRGARLLEQSSSPVLRMAASIAATHHEWWDGSGYPHGLSGESIPLAGRIVAVADVFDALTHERPYKPAWPLAQAIAAIRAGAAKQFDPRVVDAFLASVAARPRSSRARITGGLTVLEPLAGGAEGVGAFAAARQAMV